MKTNVRACSRDTHSVNIADGVYDRTTQIIMAYIRAHEGCLMTQIAAGTGLLINQISGRCNELKGGKRKRRDGTYYHSAALISEGETVETSPGHYAHRLYTVTTSTLCHHDNDSRYEPVGITRMADGQLSFI